MSRLVLALVLVLAFTATAEALPITRHDRQVVLFFAHHPKLAATPAGGRALALLLPHVVRSLQAADRARANPYAVPAWWAHSSVRACIEMRESTDGAGSSNLYGMLSPGIWGDYGSRFGPSAGATSYAVQTYVAYLGYVGQGCHGPWGRYDGCC